MTNRAPKSSNDANFVASTNDATKAAREAEGGQAARDAARITQPVLAPMPPGAPGGFTVQDGSFDRYGIPTQVVDISVAFFITCAVMVIGWPIARALGKRLERRADVPQVSAGMAEQLQRIEQAVDSMSIEVERISESQRFMAKLQNGATPERSALGAGERR